MSNPTDTNQASENALKEITKILLMYKAGLAYEHVEPQYEWLGSIDIEEAKLDLLAIIRTEKLKLLAEVREQVVGENIKWNHTERMQYSTRETDALDYMFAVNSTKDEQRTELTKLEAEL